MYHDHFQFRQAPFSIAPDPSFLYLSDGHSEALAHLMYGFAHGGFVLITGEVGTGKTTLLRNVIRQTPPDLDVAFILNPRLTVKELLETICDELGIPHPQNADATVKQYIDALNEHLLRTHQAGRSTVVIIDEAQNLSPAVLEQIRLLTNLETDERKLLRIILLGQPELASMLERTELRQLAQRITARYHLGGLTREDCYAYVAHRLTHAGGSPHLFTRAALARLYRISKGIPRLVNVVADRALLGAYVEGHRRVTARIVGRAADEVLGRRPRYRLWLGLGAGSALAAGVAVAYFNLPTPELPEPPSSNPPAVSQVPETRPVPAAPRSEPSDAAAKPAQEAPGPVRQAEPSTTGSSVASAARAPAARPTQPIRRPPMSSGSSQRDAYTAVFAAWGADYASAPPETIPCDFAPSAGLQCLGRRGSWRDIVQLNLPVVLELWDERAAPYYAAVTGIDGNRVSLHLGGETLAVTPRDLRNVWSGNYVLLWQMPPGYRGSLRTGDSHSTVSWLRNQLSGITGAPLASPLPEFFDPSLDAAVREFQRGEGLSADGIVGPLTWIRLAARLELPAPGLES